MTTENAPINAHDVRLDQLEKLRAPFPPHQISILPKPYNRDAPKSNCRECGSYHGQPAVHLSYVGHAALTDRFLEVDPEWSWEPVAWAPDGLPAFDKLGGLWIRLTLCGVTRLGYGDAQGKTGPNAIKEAIGDALRNAGMRFGAALDLWHKGDLHVEEEQPRPERPAALPSGPPVDPIDTTKLQELLDACDDLECLALMYRDLDQKAPNIKDANRKFNAAKQRIEQAEAAA